MTNEETQRRTVKENPKSPLFARRGCVVNFEGKAYLGIRNILVSSNVPEMSTVTMVVFFEAERR